MTHYIGIFLNLKFYIQYKKNMCLESRYQNDYVYDYSCNFQMCEYSVLPMYVPVLWMYWPHHGSNRGCNN